MESADAWANQDILLLDEATRLPLSVAGVPPDYFSETGQRWGNPLYRWKKGNVLCAETFRWWATAYYAPGTSSWTSSASTISGASKRTGPSRQKRKPRSTVTWVKGPGIQFFKKLREEAGHLHLIAEDLGVITPEVEKLRDDLGLPGHADTPVRLRLQQ